VSLDEGRRRLVYSVVDSPLGATHHQASVEVVERVRPVGRAAEVGETADAGTGTVLRWTTDVLPADLAPSIQALMERAAVAMAATLSGAAAA